MEEHNNDINDEVHDNDDHDDNDDDWILQQAEVWAATEKETKSNLTDKEDDNNTTQKSSDNATKSIMESPVRVSTVKAKANKKRKLEIAHDPSLRETSTSSDTTFGGNVQLQSNPYHQGPQLYSLHLTQLSYDATDFDIREHFIRHGCMNITSIRLVYDHDNNKKSDGFKKKFRGVAFVDIYMETPESYETLLHQLHGSTMLQRKINVRPVKSKVELATIVQQTKLYVHQQIQIGKEKKKMTSEAKTGDGKIEKTTFDDSKRPKKQSKKSPTVSSSSNAVNNSVDSSPVQKRNAASSKPKSITTVKKLPNNTTSPSPSLKKIHVNNATKLTKQQRNRKAAILMQHRRQSK
jgi:hypothetical protein